MTQHHFNWKNKLAPYEVKYRCTEDCIMGGCPEHIAQFGVNSVSDIFIITFKAGESGERKMYFNLEEFWMIQNFMDKLML